MELTNPGYLDSCRQVRATLNLGAVEPLENLAVVCREGDEHFRARSAHGHEADGGFGVCLSFGGVEEGDGIGLSFEAGGSRVLSGAAPRSGINIRTCNRRCDCSRCCQRCWMLASGVHAWDLVAYTIMVASNTMMAVGI